MRFSIVASSVRGVGPAPLYVCVSLVAILVIGCSTPKPSDDLCAAGNLANTVIRELHNAIDASERHNTTLAQVSGNAAYVAGVDLSRIVDTLQPADMSPDPLIAGLSDFGLLGYQGGLLFDDPTAEGILPDDAAVAHLLDALDTFDAKLARLREKYRQLGMERCIPEP